LAAQGVHQLYANMLREKQNAAEIVRRGGSFTLGARTYTGTADLTELLADIELLSVRAAISRIEEGGQSFQHGDRVYTEADLGELYERLDRLTARASRSASTGARVRRVVPI
jgi:hypothetical protein